MTDAVLPEGIFEPGESGVVPVEFLTGCAGSGKSWTIRARQTADPKYALLAATTGIAAMNLGCITLNSLLGFFDTESLEDNFFNGFLGRKVADLFDLGYKWLVIDEVSMMAARQLDIIYQAFKFENELRTMKGEPGMGICLTGDFMQLPPIKAKWVFEAECWPLFEAATTRLTGQFRQQPGPFLEGLNAIRRGDGLEGARLLQQAGVTFAAHSETIFDGTTILAKNDQVDRFNWAAHSRIPGVPTTVRSSRWGALKSDWKNIPDQLGIKDGSYVMILTNDPPEFTYVNGDCGYVRSFDSGVFDIELVRNGEMVQIGQIYRRNEQKHPPDSILAANLGVGEAELRRLYLDKEPGWDSDKRRWVMGGVHYHPIRLAYASTVHKTQGLSLDRIQVDINNHFFSAPAMLYVAFSRCRTAQGLRVIGSPQMVAVRNKIAPEALKWL